MDEASFYEKIKTRTSEANARAITDALRKAGLIAKLDFMKDGSTTSVFDINGSGLVFKVFDRRVRKHERIIGSRYQLLDYYRAIIVDKSTNDQNSRPTEVVVEMEPKLNDKEITSLHQEMLRYKLWTEEGREFWDIYPPASDFREIKNVLLDRRCVPYQIDEDAVRAFDDYHYPADINGKRTDEQYLEWRADTLNERGNPDSISKDRFAEIKAACDKCDWPYNQKKIFDPLVTQNIVKEFAKAFGTISTNPQSAIHARITNPARSEGRAH